MKILLFFPGKVWAGAEQYVYDLGQAYIERGHQVKFYYRDSDVIKNRLANEPNAHMLCFKGMYHWAWIKKMADILSTEKPDVVHVHCKSMVPPLTIAKKLAKSSTRVVMTYHDAHRNGPPLWFRSCFKNMHKMLFVSDFAFNRWHNSNRWMPLDRCATIINSVKASTGTEDTTLRQRFNIKPQTPILVFSGRVRKSKGCTTIIEALALIKDLDWQMVFIGSAKPADYTNDLIALATKLGINHRVHFTGFTPNSQAYLKEAYLGLAPSIMLDPCPLSPLEFMMCGKCVITSDSGGQPEYITDSETGIIVKPDSPAMLADAMRKMLVSPGLCAQIGENAKRHFNEHLNYNRFVDKVLEQYQ